MDFALLGPVEVRDGAADLTPAAAMPRRVLATLLLQNGRAVSCSTLIDELWGDEPPRLARKTVQTYLYQLRKLLASGPSGDRRQRLETRPNGYRLQLDPGELDVHCFQRRIAAGRAASANGDHARAASVLREALGLWRGEALGDLAHGPVLAAEAARLEDSRLGALELRVEADLRLGRHRELIGELQALTVHHPESEEFSAQLMLAAYRAGLRGDALSCYARLRRNLVSLTGLEPSERLQRLHREILASAPGLTVPERAAAVRLDGAARPAEVPAALSELIGREPQLDAVRRWVGSPGRVTSITGGPGTGKTALAVYAAQQMKERYPDGQLFVTLHGAAGAPLPPIDVLRSFLRSVGTGNPPESPEECARLFRSQTADRKLLVVLDDAASMAQVSSLLPSGPECAALITSRQRLAGLPGESSLRLGAMTPSDALALLGSVAGPGRVSREQDAARQVVALCDHLPLAVRAAGERLAARPRLGVAELAARLRATQGRLAELSIGAVDVRGRFAEALHRLDRDEQRALRALARLGTADFGTAELLRALGPHEDSARLLVDRLLDAHLLDDLGPVADADDSSTAFRMPELVRLVAETSPSCEDGRAVRPYHAPVDRSLAVRYRGAGRLRPLVQRGARVQGFGL